MLAPVLPDGPALGDGCRDERKLGPPSAYLVMAYIVMAYVVMVMVYKVMAYEDMTAMNGSLAHLQ